MYFFKLECPKPFLSPLGSRGSLMPQAAKRLVCTPNSKRTMEDLCPVSYVFFDNLCICKNLICVLAVDILTIKLPLGPVPLGRAAYFDYTTDF